MSETVQTRDAMERTEDLSLIDAQSPPTDETIPTQAPFASQQMSNHGYHESFSRSRMSVGASLDTAVSSDLLEEETTGTGFDGVNDIATKQIDDIVVSQPETVPQATPSHSHPDADPPQQSQHLQEDAPPPQIVEAETQDAASAALTGAFSATGQEVQAGHKDDTVAWAEGSNDDWLDSRATENESELSMTDTPVAPIAAADETLASTAPIDSKDNGGASIISDVGVSANLGVSSGTIEADQVMTTHAKSNEPKSFEAEAAPLERRTGSSYAQDPSHSAAPSIYENGDEAQISGAAAEALSSSDLAQETDVAEDVEQKVDEREGPDFGDTSAFDASWAEAIPSVETAPSGADETINFGNEPTLEDEWSKAFGTEEAEDDPWAALGDELGEDELLQDDMDTVPSQPAVSQPGSNPYTPSSTSFPSATAASIPTTPFAASFGASPGLPTTPAAKNAPTTPMKFFEDLPTARPSPARRPRPQQPSKSETLPMPPPSATAPATATAPPPGPARSISSQYGSFVPPPRQDLFPPQPSVAPVASVPRPTPPPSSLAASARYSPAPVASAHSVPAATQYTAAPAAQTLVAEAPALTSRYSPSPQARGAPDSSQLQMPPKQNARYSPAPVGGPSNAQQAAAPPQAAASSRQMKSPPRDFSSPPVTANGTPATHRFAPRTSSPLAYSQRSDTQGALSSQGPLPSDADLGSEQRTASVAQIAQASQASQPPPTGPRRTKTSSPEISRVRPAAARPVIGHAPFSSMSTVSASNSSAPAMTIEVHSHGRDPLDDDWVRPQDENASDPLQRWKGAPVLRWAVNGTIMTTFPTRTPRYGGGQSAPRIKCGAGEVKIQKSISGTTTPADTALLDSFPGPLKAKGKKKELLSWLSAYIEALSRDQSHTEIETLDPRIGERILLWRIMKIFIEQDGKLSGDPSVDLAVRQVVAPNAETSGLSGGPASSETMAEATVSDALDVLGQNLLRGDRERAIWHAVDNRMWAHAMLISSTVNPTIWKQVVQEFVRKEVRNARSANQSMSVLYNVFGGNFDESVDELVPASARAGFQMMSAEGSTQQQNALDALNKWQETLGLILSNRSTEDERGILALGKLLSNYGRTEAAHICYLFARSVMQFSGADDAQAQLTLFGANMTNPTSDKGVFDLEQIILSEIYEFGLSLSTTPTPAYYIPHLQSYKLRHAYALAENGSRNKALQYCEAIAAALKSTTKLSPYYHPLLASNLDDLAKRLSQVPKDGSSGWMSKPSIEKVSGSMWARFNSFVAGDDGGDAASTGSGAVSEGEPGPFGRVAGTPSISRTNSMSELYGPSAAAAFQSGPTTVSSRYAPSSTAPAAVQSASPYAPLAASQRMNMYSDTRTVSDPTVPGYQPSVAATNNRPVSQQSNYTPWNSHSQPVQPSPLHDPYTPTETQEQQTTISAQGSSAADLNNPYAPSPTLSSAGSGGPTDAYKPETTLSVASGYPQRSTSYGPPPLAGEDVTANGHAQVDEQGASADASFASSYAPPSSYEPSASYEPSTPYNPGSSYEPSTNGYDPSAGGYEPPQASSGYQPYQPEPDSPVSTRPKKGIMYDDDDDVNDSAAKAAPAEMSRAEKDRIADEAFRKAAEEDAKRDAAAKGNKANRNSWFGGWLGGGGGAGKKDLNAPVVHKAKLGEENSFVFDPVTKKWVNKKAGASAQDSPAAAATPPPPRAGPPGGGPPGGGPLGGGPPMGMAQRVLTPGPPLGPPSRSGTPASQGTGSVDIADSGVPPALQHVAGIIPPTGGPPASGPPSRPATSMSNASSIDDLLGAPAPRKGGTIKKSKKGGRYVDVMAK